MNKVTSLKVKIDDGVDATVKAGATKGSVLAVIGDGDIVMDMNDVQNLLNSMKHFQQVNDN